MSLYVNLRAANLYKLPIDREGEMLYNIRYSTFGERLNKEVNGLKIKKRITALACALALSLTQAISAFAADEQEGLPDTAQTQEHTHTYTSEVTKEATCAEEGELTYTCTECGDSYTEAIAKTTAHKYGVGEVITKAACGVEGKTVYTCKICGASYTQTIPALSHEFDEGVVTKEPTCADKGILTQTCKLCGSTFDREIAIDPAAHVWDEGEVTTEATCKDTGIKTYTCTLCGSTKEEIVPTNEEHRWDEGKTTAAPTCGKAGVKTYTCEICGLTKTEEIPATGNHYFGKGEVLQAADCTHAGLKHYTCAGCGLEVDTLIPKSAVHKFDSGKVTKAATLAQEGSIVYTCTLCGKTLTRAIPKLVDISTLTITLSTTTYTYDGNAKTPSVTVKNGSKTLVNGTDYTVAYTNNTRAGTATVTVTGKGAYTASAVRTFSVIAADMSSTTVSGVSSSYVYTGKSIAPAVTVKKGSSTLTLGSDYTITYSANKAIGKATITLKGKGNYKGRKRVTFKIIPKAVTLKSLASSKAKNLTVKWSKNTTATGYQIVYSTDKRFKTKNTTTVTGAASVSKTLTWLTSGKTYYVKVRAYKTVNGTKYYSLYSSVKSLKVK